MFETWIQAAGKVPKDLIKALPVNCTQRDMTYKAEFTEVDIFLLLQLFARHILSMKKLEIEETKTT